MSQKHEYQEARREATIREIKRAQQSLAVPSATMLARVALAVVYMYLIMMSYEVLGISGPVFISVTFLVAFFIPWSYSNLRHRLAKQAPEKPQTTVHEEHQHEA